MYPVLPCFHGACVPKTRNALEQIIEKQTTIGVNDLVLLPGNIEADRLSRHHDVPLTRTLDLDDEDLQCLDCSNPKNYSITHYGSPGQEKLENQDFAISGSLPHDSQGEFRFLVLADGMSNRVAFPKRGAMISCLAAYKSLKKAHRKIRDGDRLIDEKFVQDLRCELVEDIKTHFANDRKMLLEADFSPSWIAKSVWNKSLRDFEDRWYGNTIIVSVVSRRGGLILFCGDGYVVLIKGGVRRVVLDALSENTISRFISMDVKPENISAAVIEDVAEEDYVEVIAATDGADDLISNADGNIEEWFQEDIGFIQDKVVGNSSELSAQGVPDNLSIARIVTIGEAKKFGHRNGRLTSPQSSG